MRDWKPEYTIAIVPVAAAFVIPTIYFVFGGSATTAQWMAIIIFFVLVPFSVGRLIDRSK